MIEPEMLEKYNYASRFQKALKIERILKDCLGVGQDAGGLSCLDVGCSIGVISTSLASSLDQVVGIDPLAEAIEVAHQLDPGSKATFLRGDGLRLPFADEVFDVIVCAQVYEHSTDPHRLVSEIRRALRPGGCCFFSGPNRLWPVEHHYGWCLMHWLPRALVDRYCQHRYGHPYDLALYSYWRLRDLWQGFECYDYGLRIVYEPGAFLGRSELYRWARILPRPIASVFRFLLPNFNWVLIKTAVFADA